MNEKRIFQLSQLVKLTKKSHSTLLSAIKKSHLKASKMKVEKKKACWVVDWNDYCDYLENRYRRKRSEINGEEIYDNRNGTFNLRQLCQQHGVDYIKAYHAAREGKFLNQRREYRIVVNEKDFLEFARAYKSKKVVRKKKSCYKPDILTEQSL